MEKSWNCVFECLWEPCLLQTEYEYQMAHLSHNGECSGSVVECLTQDRGVVGSSLTAHCVVSFREDPLILA